MDPSKAPQNKDKGDERGDHMLESMANELVRQVVRNQHIFTPQLGLQLVGLSEDKESKQRKEEGRKGPRPSRDNNYCCPFVRNLDGSFSARSNPSSPYRQLDDTAVLAAHVFAKPLPDDKRQQFEVMKGLESIVRPAWAAEHGDLGTLLPPYHLAIALRMALGGGDDDEEDDEYVWMMLDKTEEGVRYRTMKEEQSECVPERLKPSESTLVAKFDPNVYREGGVWLYDVAVIVVDDPKPASLETHLGEASAIKEAITGFASTHCWGLVQRIVALFNPFYNFRQAFDFDTGRLRVTN